jgi:IS5 family transposase
MRNDAPAVAQHQRSRGLELHAVDYLFKVEHPFHVVKNLFGHRKARYEGMAKNQGQLFSLFGLANLVIAKRSLLDLQARGASLTAR